MTGFPSSASFKPTDVQSGIVLAPLAKWLSGIDSADDLNKLHELLERFRTPQSYHRVDFRVTDSSELPPSPSEAYAGIPDDLEPPIEIDESPPPDGAKEDASDTAADGAAGAPVGDLEEDKVDDVKEAKPKEGVEVTVPGATKVDDATVAADASEKPALEPPSGDTVDDHQAEPPTQQEPALDSEPSQPPSSFLPPPHSAILALADYPSPITPAADSAASPAQAPISVDRGEDESAPAKDNIDIENQPTSGPVNPPDPSLKPPHLPSSHSPPTASPQPQLTDSNITLALIALGAAGTVPLNNSQDDGERDPSSRARSPAIPDYPPPPGPTNRCVRELRVDLRTLDPAALFELESWRRKVLSLQPLAMALPDSEWYKLPSNSPPPKRRPGRPPRSLKATASASAEPSRRSPRRSVTGDIDVTLIGNPRPPATSREGDLLDEAAANGVEDVVDVEDRSPTPDNILPHAFDGDKSDDPDFMPSQERSQRARLPRVRSPEIDLPEVLETEEEEFNNTQRNQASSSMQPEELLASLAEEVGANEPKDRPQGEGSDEDEEGWLNNPLTAEEASGERAPTREDDIDVSFEDVNEPVDVDMQYELDDGGGSESIPREDYADEEEKFNNTLPGDDEEEFNNALASHEEEGEEEVDEEEARELAQLDEDDIDLPQSDQGSPARDTFGEAGEQRITASPDRESAASNSQLKPHSKASSKPDSPASTASRPVTVARRYKTSLPLSSLSRDRVSVRRIPRVDAPPTSTAQSDGCSPVKPRHTKASVTPEDEGTPEPTPPRRSTRAVPSSNAVTPEPVSSHKRARSSSPVKAASSPSEPPSGRRTRAAVAKESSPSEPILAPRSTRSARSSNNFVPPKPVASRTRVASSSPLKPTSTRSAPPSSGRRTRATAASEDEATASLPTPRRRVARPFVVLDITPSPHPPSPSSSPRRTRASAVHERVAEATEPGPSRRRPRSPTPEDPASDDEPAELPPPPKRLRVTQTAKRSKPLPPARATRARPARTPTPPPRMVLDSVEVTPLSPATRAKYVVTSEPAPLAPLFVRKTRLPVEVFAPARYPLLQVEHPKTLIVRSTAPATGLRWREYVSPQKSADKGGAVKRGARRASRKKVVEADDEGDDEWSAFKF